MQGCWVYEVLDNIEYPTILARGTDAVRYD